METKIQRSCSAFAETQKVAGGDIRDVALKVKSFLKAEPKAAVLIFDDITSEPVELDLRGTPEAVLRRLEIQPSLENAKKPGPGRPKLGVVSKEITLLPQQWEWLAKQPGGASVTLRKLIEEYRKKNQAKDQLRQAQEATYKFMTAMAGNLPGFEEALRAFYAKDAAKFNKMISAWPKDIREYTHKLAKASF